MATTSEAKPREGDARESQVRTIFSEIAPRYDLLNHVLSMNIDRAWRRKAVDRLGWERRPEGRYLDRLGWERRPEGRYLDACSGTFDLSLELADRKDFGGQVVGSDFALPMLAEGRTKLEGAPVVPVCADTLRLPFTDGTFDGATVGFGVRNLSNLEVGFREFARVLRPGSRLVILEFTVPPNPVVRAGYMLYFTKILPVVGRIVSGHPWAYSYLPESVKDFPGPDALVRLLEDAGFERAEYELLTVGIAALHVATMPG